MTSLKELRESLGVTQGELAKRMGTHQSEVSRIENSRRVQQDHRMSTLHKYIEALGGKLEVVAWINGKGYKLNV